LFFLLQSCNKPGTNRPVKYIAYIGFNYLNTAKDSLNGYSDSLYLVALNTYLDRINETEYPVKYQLKAYQCDYRTEMMPDIYRQIAADTNIVLVIDNTWGRYIKEGRDIIRGRIPVISLSADQNKGDFGGNAIFLQPNDPQPNYLVQYIREIEKEKSVGFITECDYLLHERFLESLESNGIGYDSICLWQRSYIENRDLPEDTIRSMQQQLDRLFSRNKHRVFLLNTHGGFGDEIIRYLENAPTVRNKVFVGISTSLSDAKLEEVTLKRGHKFIRLVEEDEALPQTVYADKKEIAARYSKPYETTDREKIAGADNQLHRCYDAVNIFRAALEDRKYGRDSMLHYFRRLKNRKINVGSELYSFDSLLILKKAPNFEQVDRGKTRSCPSQMNTEGKVIPNLRVGIDVIDINDIDVRKNTFDCNLLYWVIADSQYIMKEGYVDFSNISSEEANRYMIAEEKMDNYRVRIYRISGKFQGNFKSFEFPFDRHELVIPIVALSSSDKLRISFDYSRLQINDKIEDFQFNDWDSEEYFVTVDNQLSNALASLDKVTFDPNDKAKYLETYKSLNVHLGVSRQPWGAIILIILPFMMFSALPLFMLFYHKASYEEAGELIITSFLATVAYSINLVQISPATDSLNLAYIFLVFTLAVNFFCFLFVSLSYSRSRKQSAGKKGGFVSGKHFKLWIWLPIFLLGLFMALLYLVQ
jgi:hypothetical protein